jgi:hypothetical protein
MSHTRTRCRGESAKLRRSGVFHGKAAKCRRYQSGDPSAQATSAESIMVK